MILEMVVVGPLPRPQNVNQACNSLDVVTIAEIELKPRPLKI